MSTFSQQTKHPVTGEWHEATWMDDFYGRHRYGVRFPSGETLNPDKIQLETREDEPQESTMKEMCELCNGIGEVGGLTMHNGYDNQDCSECNGTGQVDQQENTMRESINVEIVGSKIKFSSGNQSFTLGYISDKKEDLEWMEKTLKDFFEKETALAYEQGRNAKGSSFRLGYDAGRSEMVAEERKKITERVMAYRNESHNSTLDIDTFLSALNNNTDKE